MIKVRTMTRTFLFKNEAVVMLKRSENKSISPGLWAYIGGQVEANKYNNLPQIACSREISEETGISVGQVENLKLRYLLFRQVGTEIMNLEMPTTLKLMLSHYNNNRVCQDVWTGTLSLY